MGIFPNVNVRHMTSNSQCESSQTKRSSDKTNIDNEWRSRDNYQATSTETWSDRHGGQVLQ